MQINITGNHIEVTHALREYINNKFTKLERHFDKIVTCNVIMRVTAKEQEAEASIHIKGRDVVAKSAHSDMYSAIDLLVDKLDKQLIKHKEIDRQKR